METHPSSAGTEARAASQGRELVEQEQDIQQQEQDMKIAQERAVGLLGIETFTALEVPRLPL
eukprot:766344-Hanusia_phi.AAC.2